MSSIELPETYSAVFRRQNERILEIEEAVITLSPDREEEISQELDLELITARAKTVLINAYSEGLRKVVGGGLLSDEERLFVDFGFFDPDLVSERKEIIPLIAGELKRNPTTNTGVQLFYLSDWFRKIYNNEFRTTFFMLQDAATRKELREKEFDKDSAIYEELEILKEIRKSCARRGNVPGSIPVLTSQWIDHAVEECLNTRKSIIQKIQYFENLCPRIFFGKGKKERIQLLVIIFPGSGYGTSASYQNEGRIFMPLLNPPGGISADISQSEKSIINSIASLCWSIRTPFTGWQDNPEALPGKYYQWRLQNTDGKGMTSRHFIDDLLLYLTKEAGGTQALDKKLRQIFWEELPYSRRKREELAQRARVFADLNKKLNNYYEKKGL